MSRLPDFLVIGAMKCATSTLHEQLARQPGVFMSTPKEPNFFSDDDVYARGIEWYTSLFARAAPHDLCGESSTHYTKLPTHPHTIDRLAEALPRVRLAYIMRHPIDRLVSHFIHAWTKREVPRSIDRAVRTRPELIDCGRYAMQLRPYITQYGRDAILPVFLARLRAEPDAELARIGRFIGLARLCRWDHTLERQNESHRRTRDSALRSIVRNVPGVRQCVPPDVRAWMNRRLAMTTRPELSQASRGRVTAIFNEDLAQLGEWLGVADLRCDTFDEIASRPIAWRSVQEPAPAA